MKLSFLLCLLLLAASLAPARQPDTEPPAGPPPPDASAAPSGPPQAVPTQPATEAEPPEAPPGTNDMSGHPDLGANKSGAPDDEEARSSTPGAGGSGRTDPRESRRRRFDRERQRIRDSQARRGRGADSATNSLAALDYSAFKIIAELNIFDPNRVPAGAPPVHVPPTEYFGLVGTMRYDKGTFAFFSGSGSKYDKALKVSDSIAGYKLTSISENAVKLESQPTNAVAGATNAATPPGEIEMRMGMQMRRQESGPWRLSESPSSETSDSSFSSSSSSSTSTSSSSATSADGESDVIKKMMQRRDKE